MGGKTVPENLLCALMKFSVIIPAYNAAATLAQTLESLVQQQLPPHEVIVVVDGATDDSEAIARSYEDRLPLTILVTENKGLGAARNLGMQNATGEAIAFLDSDDLWSWNRLSLAASFIKKYPRKSWFYGPVFEFHLGEKMRTRACPVLKSKADFLTFNPIVPSAVILRSSMEFCWEEDRNLLEDLGPFLGTLSSGNIPVKIPHVGVKYRVDHGLTSDLNAHYKKVWASLDAAEAAGVIGAAERALYEVRKMYEAARTCKKRGDEDGRSFWKGELALKQKEVAVPFKLRWRIALLT